MLTNHQRKIEIKFQIMFDEKKMSMKKQSATPIHTFIQNDKYLMFDSTGNVTFAVGATSIF